MRSLCRGHTKETIQRLSAIMRDPGKEGSASSSVAAAQLLLSYGWGKPAQPLTGEDGEGAIEIIIRNITEGKK